ncbi:MAG TPA: hypothetical protein DDW81_13555 [Cryomorphaceae bacterium]|nr:hypothetical protein [Cryomorphaceae bacterium]
MPMKFYALLGLLCLNTIAFAQNWDYYTPFQASGPVPGDFTDVYVNKYQRGVQTISKTENRKSRRRKDDFYRKSEYFINEYLVSGNVFFGDTITNYCQSIVNKLIGDDKTLKEQIRVYSVKSPVVNATATASGIIFVNTGLIAQLETEAQLAYILSHELTHYTENHVLDQYIEREEVLNGENAYRKSSYDEKMLALSTYSKSQELEADKKGYTRFYSNLPYNPSAPHEVLDILQYAELPFDEFAFPKDFFDTQYLVFPADYHLEETAPITAAADYDDKGSTHPNLENRREALGGVIPKMLRDPIFSFLRMLLGTAVKLPAMSKAASIFCSGNIHWLYTIPSCSFVTILTIATCGSLLPRLCRLCWFIIMKETCIR